MKKHCGVDTTTKLKKKQAYEFFTYILDEIKKYPAVVETQEAPAEGLSPDEAAEAARHAKDAE